ncbi:uncharacterized protein LOC127618099 isoform X2 [Xyrauchen texanus]|uniref:uncharacterized protein LOC127618099 isoform X2 n=1 Tax=Xyrauchen texanus TaxID=154827 RepID=UPI0022420CAF|nr:uncharacterized protein LOC127618099 isoform X2 [Xyrauchen texanus]
MDPYTMIAAGVGLVAAVAAAPAVLAAVGFTGAGIAAGSLAASMMSSAAVASGGGVAAGSAVALLQSVGAAGISLLANAAIGAVGATVGAALGGTLFLQFRSHSRFLGHFYDVISCCSKQWRGRSWIRCSSASICGCCWNPFSSKCSYWCCRGHCGCSCGGDSFLQFRSHSRLQRFAVI